MTAGERDLAADVQRFGLLSAAVVVNRYAAVVDRVLSPSEPRRSGSSPQDPPEGPGDLRLVADSAARFAQASLRLLDAGVALVERSARETTSAADEVLELPAVPPGGCSEAPVWVHNPTELAADVSLHATPLLDGDGHRLAVRVVGTGGGRSVPVPPGASGELTVRVQVPVDQFPGCYHGVLVGSGTPEPVRITVQVNDSHRARPS